MSNKIISDNWSLQDLSMLFDKGLDFDSTSRIKIYRNENKFNWEEIPRYFVQIKLLINFLNDIILRDNILVDQEFINCWDNNELLATLNRDQIIKPLIYHKNNSEVKQLRKIILEQICVTDDM